MTENSTKPANSQANSRSVFFISDGTGITAETLGNSLLALFPDYDFLKATIPFVNTIEFAQSVVRHISEIGKAQTKPVVFSTVVQTDIRELVNTADAFVIDLLTTPTQQLEDFFGRESSHESGRSHAQGNIEHYNNRMRAVEFALEHDDGQSLRMLDLAELILIAPSRCGKTPTSMYLALQHGVFVANYPLIQEDFDSLNLPKPIRDKKDKLFGLISTPQRLSEVRNQRRPDSKYASLEQARFEIRNAEEMYLRHNIPYINSANKSVEEMSSVIMQRLTQKNQLPR